MMSRSSLSFPEEKGSTSRISKRKGSYSFRIENFTGMSTRVGESTESPEFEICGYLWQLRIFPGGSLEAHKKYVSFYLASKANKSARASYKLMVKNQAIGSGSDEVFVSSGVRLFEAKGVQIDGWGRDKFMLLENLLDSDSGFLVNDAVIFKVEVNVYGEMEQTFPLVYDIGDCAAASLGASLGALRKDGLLTDISIIAGSTTLNAHRAILAGRSRVFRAMLASGYSESAEGVVRVADTDAAVLNEMLEFMYTDEITCSEVLESRPEDLLLCACKYQVEGLVKLCESHLIDSLDADNCLSRLALADTLSLALLKEKALFSAVSGLGKEYASAKEYGELHPDLRFEVAQLLDKRAKRKGCGGLMMNTSVEKRFTNSCVIL